MKRLTSPGIRIKGFSPIDKIGKIMRYCVNVKFLMFLDLGHKCQYIMTGIAAPSVRRCYCFFFVFIDFVFTLCVFVLRNNFSWSLNDFNDFEKRDW